MGKLLLLWDVDIRPIATNRLAVGAVTVRRLLGTIGALAAADGFDTLVVNGYRINGANPSRFLEIAFDCRPSRLGPRLVEEISQIAGVPPMAEPRSTVPQTAELSMAIAEARRILAEGKTLEDVWRLLRSAGFDMTESKRFAMSISGMSSREAQRAVYESDTWADVRPVVDQIEDAMIEAALDFGAEVRIDGRPITDKNRV